MTSRNMMSLVELINVVDNAAELTALKNKIASKIDAIENSKALKNREMLLEETLNLLDEVGEGYVEGDYYAPTRYYSQIKGVKNIRVGGKPWWVHDAQDGDIFIKVKVDSPSGYLIPEEIVFEDIIFRYYIERSSKYCGEVDY